MDVLNNLKALGCSDPVKVMMAHQTYLELSVVEHYTDITYVYNEELDLIYLRGSKNDVQSTLVPVHSSSNISLNWLRNVRSKLCPGEEESIILVIRDADSNSVRYKLSDGLILPPVTSNRLLRKRSEKPAKKLKLSDPAVSTAE